MSDESNSRADAKLKRLPVEIHIEIVERLGAKDAKQTDVLAWLKKYHGLEASPSSFSRSLPFIRQRVKAHGREQVILAKMSEKKAAELGITDEELFAWGQRQFQEMAIADEDPQAWVALMQTKLTKESAEFKAWLEKEKLALKKQAEARAAEEFKLAREKFEFDAAKAALAHAAELKTIATSKLSEGEKVNRARQRLFGVLPT
jgi:hypothetical protein